MPRFIVKVDEVILLIKFKKLLLSKSCLTNINKSPNSELAHSVPEGLFVKLRLKHLSQCEQYR